MNFLCFLPEKFNSYSYSSDLLRFFNWLFSELHLDFHLTFFVDFLPTRDGQNRPALTMFRFQVFSVQSRILFCSRKLLLKAYDFYCRKKNWFTQGVELHDQSKVLFVGTSFSHHFFTYASSSGFRTMMSYIRPCTFNCNKWV